MGILPMRTGGTPVLHAKESTVMSDQRTVTAKRRAANRAAAQRSTGPKTEEGKQRAVLNSLQHGAFATENHIREAAAQREPEGPAELLDLRRQLAGD